MLLRKFIFHSSMKNLSKLRREKVTLIAVSADEPAGKPVVDCEKQTVCLTIHHGAEDDKLLQEKWAVGFLVCVSKLSEKLYYPNTDHITLTLPSHFCVSNMV